MLVKTETGGGWLLVICETLLGGMGCVGNCTNLAVVVEFKAVGWVGNLAIRV